MLFSPVQGMKTASAGLHVFKCVNWMLMKVSCAKSLQSRNEAAPERRGVEDSRHTYHASIRIRANTRTIPTLGLA